MKLYKITKLKDDSEERVVVAWRTSDSDASALCTVLKLADKLCEPKREQIEVPTTRTELVAWLNENAVTAKAPL